MDSERKITDLRLMGKLDEPVCPAPLNARQRTLLEGFRRALETGTIKLTRVDRCLCGGENSYRFAAIDRWGLPFASHLCQECGLIYTNPRIAPESLEAFYEDFYHQILSAGSPKPRVAIYKRGQGEKVYNILRPRLTRMAFKILDVGCGTGSVMKEFAALADRDGFEVSGIGIDLNRELVESFDPEGKDLRALHGSLEAVDNSEGPFDVMILSHVLEHFPEPVNELERLRRLCRDDALLFVEVPGVMDLRSRADYDADWLKYFTCAHMYHFNLISLTRVLNLSGFALVWGNETVEAVFSPGRQIVETEGNAARVIAYLDDLESSHKFYSSLLALRADADTLQSAVKELGWEDGRFKARIRDLRVHVGNLYRKIEILAERLVDLNTRIGGSGSRLRKAFSPVKRLWPLTLWRRRPRPRIGGYLQRLRAKAGPKETSGTDALRREAEGKTVLVIQTLGWERFGRIIERLREALPGAGLVVVHREVANLDLLPEGVASLTARGLELRPDRILTRFREKEELGACAAVIIPLGNHDGQGYETYISSARQCGKPAFVVTPDGAVHTLSFFLATLEKVLPVREPFVLVPRCVPWNRFAGAIEKIKRRFGDKIFVVLESNPVNMIRHDKSVVVFPYRGKRFKPRPMRRQIGKLVDWGACSAVVIPWNNNSGLGYERLSRFAVGVEGAAAIALTADGEFLEPETEQEGERIFWKKAADGDSREER